MEPFIQSYWSLLLGIISTKLHTGMYAVLVAAHTAFPLIPAALKMSMHISANSPKLSVMKITLCLKNCVNLCPGPQEVQNSQHNIMDMNPTRRDCITYVVPCIPL